MSIYDRLKGTAERLINRFENPSDITHETQVRTDDGGGGVSVYWSIVATYKGVVLPVSGDERVELERANVVATHSVYLLPADGSEISDGDRFTFDGRVFNVQWRKNVAEGDVVYKIMCEEGRGA